jgi:phosphoenolpyruvate synthase/pyruvate phosphate dikinase
MLKTRWIRWFSEFSIDDVVAVGVKNASLGEKTHDSARSGFGYHRDTR